MLFRSDTFIDGQTLKMYAPDLPAVMRDWIHVNNPEGIYFPCPSREVHDNDPDFELLNYD